MRSHPDRRSFENKISSWRLSAPLYIYAQRKQTPYNSQHKYLLFIINTHMRLYYVRIVTCLLRCYIHIWYMSQCYSPWNVCFSCYSYHICTIWYTWNKQYLYILCKCVTRSAFVFQIRIIIFINVLYIISTIPRAHVHRVSVKIY